VYYERWKVKAGKIDPGNGIDTFETFAGFGRDSRSLVRYRQDGDVAFFSGPGAPPGTWHKRDEGGHCRWAGILETTCNAPMWPYGRVVLRRGISMNWDCCCDPHTETFNHYMFPGSGASPGDDLPPIRDIPIIV